MLKCQVYVLCISTISLILGRFLITTADFVDHFHMELNQEPKLVALPKKDKKELLTINLNHFLLSEVTSIQ